MPANEEKETQKALKTLFISSIVVFFGIVLSKVVTYAYRIVIARSFDPETYGLFSLAVMIIGWLAIIAQVGLPSGILRYVSFQRGLKETKNIETTYKKALSISLLLSIILGVAIFFTADFISVTFFNQPGLAIFLKIFSFCIPMNTALAFFFSILRAYEKIGWLSFFSNILSNLSKLVIIVWLVLAGLGTISVPLSYALGTAIVLFWAFFIIQNLFKEQRLEGHEIKSSLREVFAYSWPLTFFSLAASMFHWTDTLVLGIYRTVAEVGIYNVAVPIALLLMFSNDLFRQLFFPIVSKEYAAGNKKTVIEVSKQISKWTFMSGIPVFLLLIFFPEQIISLLFGSQYLSATQPLRILAVGILFWVLSDNSRELVLMKGKSKTILVDMLSVGIINLILNLLWVPKYGMIGAAISTTISVTLLSLIYVAQAYKSLGFLPLRKKMLNLLFIFLFFGAIFWWINLNYSISTVLFLLICLALAVFYPLAILVTKTLDRNDRLIVRKIMGKLKNRQNIR